MYIEVGAKRVFASAAAWPGWSRSGRDEAGALEALAAYRARYEPVVSLAGLNLLGGAFEVVERIPGDATTDFGAPSGIASAEHTPLGAAAAKRQASLIAAGWRYLDQVVAGAPAELRKGPRGGGRDRDKVFLHVLGAEVAYAGKLAIMGRDLPADDAGPGSARRAALLERLGAPWDGTPFKEKGWPPAYAARRIAWHALDHAWEIEDRSV